MFVENAIKLIIFMAFFERLAADGVLSAFLLRLVLPMFGEVYFKICYFSLSELFSLSS